MAPLPARQNLIVDRQMLAQLSDDPRMRAALESLFQVSQETPDAVNAAVATANEAKTEADAAVAAAAAATAQVNNVAAAAFLVTALSTDLTNERVLGGGAGVTIDTSTPDLATIVVDPKTAMGAQAANLVLAGPTAGGSAVSTFRPLVVADFPGSLPSFSVHQNGSSQSIAASSFVKVQFNTHEWNTGDFVGGTSRFTPTTAGKYQLNGTISLAFPGAINSPLIAVIFKNGVEYKRGSHLTETTSGAASIAVTVSCLVDANGSSDYFELFVFQATGGSRSTNAGAAETWFQGAFVCR